MPERSGVWSGVYGWASSAFSGAGGGVSFTGAVFNCWRIRSRRARFARACARSARLTLKKRANAAARPRANNPRSTRERFIKLVQWAETLLTANDFANPDAEVT